MVKCVFRVICTKAAGGRVRRTGKRISKSTAPALLVLGGLLLFANSVEVGFFCFLPGLVATGGVPEVTAHATTEGESQNTGEEDAADGHG